MPSRPRMLNRSIRFPPKVWAKVEARAAEREQAPAEWVRRLVEQEVEDDPDPGASAVTRPWAPLPW